MASQASAEQSPYLSAHGRGLYDNPSEHDRNQGYLSWNAGGSSGGKHVQDHSTLSDNDHHSQEQRTSHSQSQSQNGQRTGSGSSNGDAGAGGSLPSGYAAHHAYSSLSTGANSNHATGAGAGASSQQQHQQSHSQPSQNHSSYYAFSSGAHGARATGGSSGSNGSAAGSGAGGLSAPTLDHRNSNGGGSGYSTPSLNAPPSRPGSTGGPDHGQQHQQAGQYATAGQGSHPQSASHSPMHTSHNGTPGEVPSHTAFTGAGAGAGGLAAYGAGYRSASNPALATYAHAHPQAQQQQPQQQSSYFHLYPNFASTYGNSAYGSGGAFAPGSGLASGHSTPGLGLGGGAAAGRSASGSLASSFNGSFGGAGSVGGMGASSFNGTAAGLNGFAQPHVPLAGRHRVTTTLWEDEDTLCFQVDARGVCVARRDDNSMVNGTKLLNVCGMSRGKRDGILKNEKERIVVKVGAMHLKGVWITFERAKQLAEQNGISDLLYPLFEPNIQQFMYHPENLPRTAAVFAAAQERQHYPPGSNIHSAPTSAGNSARPSLSAGSVAPPPLLRASSSPLHHRVGENGSAWPAANYPAGAPTLKLNGTMSQPRQISPYDELQRRATSESFGHSPLHHESYPSNLSLAQMNSAGGPPPMARRISGLKRDRDDNEGSAGGSDSFHSTTTPGSMRNSLSTDDTANTSIGSDQFNKRSKGEYSSLSRSSSGHSLRQGWMDQSSSSSSQSLAQQYQQAQQQQQLPQPQMSSRTFSSQQLPSIHAAPAPTFYYSNHNNAPSQLFHHQQ